jgi:MFS family permease
MFLGHKFPQTERVTSGATYSEMLKSIVSPLFLFMAFFMMFTAATEQGTMQWITVLLSHSFDMMFSEGVSSILILVWISAVMALARLVAGPVIHKMSGIGVLLFSAVVSGIGLYLMSISSGIVLFASATVFAIGVAYFWPNMLGVVAEKIPKSGALGLALIGGFGFLGGSIAQPAVGHIYDLQLLKYGNELEAGAMTLQYVIVLTVILTIAFLYLFLKYRKKVNNSESAL